MNKERKTEKYTVALTPSQVEYLEVLKNEGSHISITKVIYDLINKDMILSNKSK